MEMPLFCRPIKKIIQNHFLKRGPGLVKDSFHGEGYLIFTRLILIQLASTGEQGLRVTGARTPAPLTPLELKEVALVCLFRGKLPLKLDQTHEFLLHQCSSIFLRSFRVAYLRS